MINEIKTIYEGARSELIDKKSRFISTTHPIESEEDAINFITTIKKEHYNAAHNCYAYCIGEHNEIVRCSDDGEPSGTAGKPILDVLLGMELHNIIIVVTRYFGGTLLGTGGLVRAYSRSAGESIKNSTIITKQIGTSISLQTDYNGIGKIQHLLASQSINIMDTQYTDNVMLQILVPIHKIEDLEKSITEVTNGKTLITRGEQLYFATINGDLQVFE